MFSSTMQAMALQRLIAAEKGRCSWHSLWDIVEEIATERRTVLRLPKLLLRPSCVETRGRILNTASVAGFKPSPLLATYFATKAFVLS